MNEARKQFAERLTVSEPTDPGLRENYEKELRAMLENKLSSGQRLRWWITGLFCLLGVPYATWIGVAAMSAAKPDFFLPAYIGSYFFLTSFALLATTIVVGAALWRGAYHRATHGKVMSGIAVSYLALVGWIFVLGGFHTPEPLQNDMKVFGLVILIYAAIAWVRHRIGQAELNTREKLLEIELRLAQIAEALEAKGGTR